MFSSSHKKASRLRRAKRTRAHIKSLEQFRLAVHKTPNHTYAQLISAEGDKVLAAASTTEKEVKSQLKHGGNIDAATKVGKLIAERAIAAGIKQVAFDRSGFRFHGRVKALADAARENGLDF